jgi:hypothetical protein
LTTGSVLSSRGANEDNTVAPSLYATLTDGYLEQLYFMVNGSVMVEKINGCLKITVNAFNSYDIPIKVVYNASSTTGIENTKTENNDVCKVLKNNQFIIIKEGIQYNPLGSIVK